MQPLQPGDLDLELFDQQIAAQERVFSRLTRGPFSIKRLALRGHEMAQRFDGFGG